MPLFLLTNLAKNDLRTIAKFTEQKWTKNQRNIYIKQFDETFKTLAKNPEIGKHCAFIKEGYQKFPQGNHVIFYRKVPSGNVEIIRILHKKMDVGSKLSHS